MLDATGAERIRNWKYACDDPSISTKLLTPFWEWCAKRVPARTTPNTITALSAMCNLLSAVAALMAAGCGPNSTAGAWLCVAAFGFAFGGQTLDAIDGKHARNTGQASPLGEYWDHGCDACTGPAVAVITMAYAFGTGTVAALWVCTLTFVTGFREPHLEALCTGRMRFPKWWGVGEINLVLNLALLLRAARGNIGLFGLFPLEWQGPGPFETCHLLIWLLTPPLLMLGGAVWRGVRSSQHRASSLRLLACYACEACACAYGLAAPWWAADDAAQRALSVAHPDSALWRLSPLHTSGPRGAAAAFEMLGPLMGIGIVGTVATMDVIIAKMSGAEVHSWTPPLTAALCLANFAVGWEWAVAGSLVYHAFAVKTVCDALRLPLFRRARVVYTDGVFDMLHVGHFKLLKNAASHGDKLVVGLGSDRLCSGYKRRPLMSEDERRDALLALPWVSSAVVVTDWEISEAFLRKHRIDAIAHGAEYDPVVNPEFARRVAAGESMDYYKISRETLPWLDDIPLPRTVGISTSELVSRVGARLETEPGATRRDGGPANKKMV
jgi:cytidyltransferase-like protein